MSTADALLLGVSKGQLAGPGWCAPYRGVHRPAAPAGPTSALQRIHDVAELLPAGAALGGWAAAHLLGAHELDGRGWTGYEIDPVPVILPPPMVIRGRPGLIRWRSRLGPDEIVTVDGIACSTAVRTGFDLVRTRGLRSGVICLDLLGRQIGLSPAAVLAHIAGRRGWKGLPKVAAAVDLADPRARSTGETRLRLLWVLDAGLPRPEVNPELFGPEGFLLGVSDLLDPESGMVGEYDGEGHRELSQHVRDNAREEWMEDAGLIVVRAGGPDIWAVNRRRTVRRLETAHRRGALRDRDRDRWSWRPQPRLV